MQFDWVAALSALAGALIGVLGGVITTAMQLRHDRYKGERERVFAIRRDVFLEFADAAAKPLIYLGGISNPEIPIKELTAVQQATLGPNNKMHGVAGLETIQAMLAAHEFFFAVSAKLMIKRVELERFNGKLAALDAQIAEGSARASQISTTLHSLSSLPQPDSARVNAFVQVLDEVNTQSGALHAQRVSVARDRLKQQMSLASESISRSAEYARYLARLNLAMRKEMELPLDSTYEKIVMESQARVQATYDQFAKELNEMLLKEPGNGSPPGSGS
jgi:hypothetical protein